MSVTAAKRAMRRWISETIPEAPSELLKRQAVSLWKRLEEPFKEAIEYEAEKYNLTIEEVLLINLAYDLANATSAPGCSTYIVQGAPGPVHARNLDWPLPPDLRALVEVRDLEGPAGKYKSVAWPGQFGVLTAMAPGRFSVAINYVTHNKESRSSAAMFRASEKYWPVTWLTRWAMDNMRTYRGAYDTFSTMPVLSPVLFSVAGTTNRQGALIERAVKKSVCARSLEMGQDVMVTNHYQSMGGNIDLEEIDTEARLSILEALLATNDPQEGAFDILSDEGLICEDTQHQVLMQAATGLLKLQIP